MYVCRAKEQTGNNDNGMRTRGDTPVAVVVVDEPIAVERHGLSRSEARHVEQESRATGHREDGLRSADTSERASETPTIKEGRPIEAALVHVRASEQARHRTLRRASDRMTRIASSDD